MTSHKDSPVTRSYYYENFGVHVVVTLSKREQEACYHVWRGRRGVKWGSLILYQSISEDNPSDSASICKLCGAFARGVKMTSLSYDPPDGIVLQNPKFDVQEDVLVEGSTYNRTDLKRRLLKDGLLVSKCSECNQEPEWKGKSLVMVLDHINGVSDDNRRKNLRLLCPNCNSQTDTFAGRNAKIAR